MLLGFFCNPPLGLTRPLLGGSLPGSYIPITQVKKSYSCNVGRLKLMHTNWVIKGYDQCVTCLADDPQNLVTRSSTLRTTGILSQENNSIHKQSSKYAWVKLK